MLIYYYSTEYMPHNHNVNGIGLGNEDSDSVDVWSKIIFSCNRLVPNIGRDARNFVPESRLP